MTFATIMIACVFASNPTNNPVDVPCNQAKMNPPAKTIQLDDSEMKNLLREGIVEMERSEQFKNRSRIG